VFRTGACGEAAGWLGGSEIPFRAAFCLARKYLISIKACSPYLERRCWIGFRRSRFPYLVMRSAKRKSITESSTFGEWDGFGMSVSPPGIA
jgi:hypothetical protein